MSKVSVLPRRPVAKRDLSHLPAEEAVEVMIGETADASMHLMTVLHGGNVTSERLELASAVETAQRFVKCVEGDLATLTVLEQPATEQQISEHLAILIGCLAGSKTDKATYGTMLLVDVRAAAPSIGALEAACRKLRRTSVFVPSIAEVLQALEEAARNLKALRFKVERLPKLVEDGRRRLEDRRRSEEDDRKRRRARIREDIANRRSLWAHNPDEVAEVNAEMVAEGLPGIQGDW